MIDLTQLASAHEATSIERHKKLLEEIFYLSLNESFNSSVALFRTEISEMLANIEIKNAQLPSKNRELAREYRDAIVFSDIVRWYRRRQIEISNTHHYFHPSFIRDYPSLGSDNEVRGRFNILENIIFLNAPILTEDTRDHFDIRSGYMEIADDEPTGPYIRIVFDIGTSIKQMVNIIDKQYPEISREMTERYRIPDVKRFDPDDRLMEKVRIFELHATGKSDAHIGVRLKKEGVSLEEANAEAINSIRRRAQEKIDRFNS
jgi:hypothetical protein